MADPASMPGGAGAADDNGFEKVHHADISPATPPLIAAPIPSFGEGVEELIEGLGCQEPIAPIAHPAPVASSSHSTEVSSGSVSSTTPSSSSLASSLPSPGSVASASASGGDVIAPSASCKLNYCEGCPNGMNTLRIQDDAVP